MENNCLYFTNSIYNTYNVYKHNSNQDVLLHMVPFYFIVSAGHNFFLLMIWSKIYLISLPELEAFKTIFSFRWYIAAILWIPENTFKKVVGLISLKSHCRFPSITIAVMSGSIVTWNWWLRCHIVHTLKCCSKIHSFPWRHSKWGNFSQSSTVSILRKFFMREISYRRFPCTPNSPLVTWETEVSGFNKKFTK